MLKVIETVLAFLVGALRREVTKAADKSAKAFAQSDALAVVAKNYGTKALKASNLAVKLDGLLK